MTQPTIRRKIRSTHRRLRELWMIARGLASTGHPILAHLIPIRRCNLSCTYCNEFDDFSKPLAIPVLTHRVDLLARLGTSVITISGGEPLLHPQLEDLIRHIRSRGLMAGMITNGYLLTPDRIQKLNEAGLDHLQISIDNVMPDETSKKSLKVLDQKLVMLGRYADFSVNINSVLGSPVRKPEDALTVAKRAKALGFTSTVGILHDHSGQFLPLSEDQQHIYLEILDLEKRSYSRFFSSFQRQIAHGQTRQWRCRAGSRYLYICEDGLVHYCSQQRGFPGVPLENYGPEQLRHEYLTQKSCAPRCTVSCVQVIGLFDNWRGQQTRQAFSSSREDLVQVATSASDRN
ncbi:MAG: radical SAM protein [Terriglobia bacterium]